MIDHFCGHDRFEQALHEQGIDAAMKLLEDVITDVDYYDDSR